MKQLYINKKAKIIVVYFLDDNIIITHEDNEIFSEQEYKLFVPLFYTYRAYWNFNSKYIECDYFPGIDAYAISSFLRQLNRIGFVPLKKECRQISKYREY